MLGKVNGRWGVCEYFLKDEYVGRSVRNYGEYNPDETEKILDLARDAGEGICLDVGANIGCISQALLSSGERVVAYEPQPEVWNVLSRNMVSAGGIGVAYNRALGSQGGMATMPKLDYSAKNNIGGLGLGRGATPWAPVINVEVSTLDNEAILNGWTRVKFIKMGVEGFELEALKGGVELIKRDKPIMYIEDDRVEKSAQLRAYIRELGYWIEEHKPTLFRERNFFNLNKNIWDRNYASHNIICRPC